MRTGRPCDTEEQFWNKKQIDSNGCWIWSKGKSPKGYGQATWKNKTWRAHRLAFYLTYNELPEAVCHTCDNPPCINPSHLFAGTHKDNAIDRSKKNRGFKPKGERHHHNKYSNEDILEMRRLHAAGSSNNQIAKKFSAHSNYIYQIVRRKRWAHI